MGWWDQDERFVYRERFDPLWLDLPSLLILAALPGWGKRTLMRQCASYLRRHAPGTHTVWMPAGADVAARLDLAREQERADEVVLCVDARHDPPRLWEDLEAALRVRPWAKAIVACYDGPPTRPGGPMDADDGLRRVVLHEADLAFDATELTEIGMLLAEVSAFYHPSMFSGNEKGCPALLGQRIERTLARGKQGAWTSAERPEMLEGIDLLVREEGHAAEALARSRIGAVLRDIHELPAFTADLIQDAAGGPEAAETVVSRLAAVPYFEVDDDDEAETRQCRWNPVAWRRLQAREQPGQTRARLERGLARVRRAGRLAPQLGLLLELGDLAGAEQLVAREYRSFLIFSDSRVASMLNDEARITPAAQPMLTLLRNEFGIRKGAFSPQIRAENRVALKQLAARRPAVLYPEIRRAGQLAYAGYAAGSRTVAVRSITHLLQLLDQVGASGAGAGNGAGAAGLGEVDRRCVLDACFLAYWAALQVDRLVDAVKLGEAMARWGSPEDRLHTMDVEALAAAQDALGLRSLASDGAGPHADRHSQAQALLALEEGRDAEARQFMAPLIAQFGVGYSRSALDAVALLVQAITSTQETTTRRTEQVLEHSAKLWDDGVPSTFLTWAVVTTFASIGAKDEARACLDRIDGVPAQDPFAAMARMTWSLWNGQPKATLDILQSMGETPMPRLVVCAWVFAATSFAQLGDRESARLSLEEAWRVHPAPRLFRFALRLIPQAAFQRLRDTVAPTHESLSRVFDDAAPDRRTLTWDERPRLTRTEREILQALGEGKSNAEIARARFIAIGTLRTHLKSLYKKLGASDRAEAVSAGARFELMDH